MSSTAEADPAPLAAPEHFQCFEIRNPPETENESIRIALEKRFSIDYIDSVTAKDVEITRDGGNWNVKVDYDATAPFFANVSFLVHFEKTVSFGGNSAQ